jgi:hypothetical protein
VPVPHPTPDPFQAQRAAERARQEAERQRRLRAEHERQLAAQRAAQAENERKQFRVAVEQNIKEQPQEALRMLVEVRRVYPGVPIIKPDEQARFARRAIEALAERVDAEKDVWKALAWVRTAGLDKTPQAVRRDLGDDVVCILGSMGNRLERRGLVDLCQEIRQRAEAGQWSEASARPRVVPQGSVRAALEKSRWKLPAPAAEALDAVSHQARFQAALTELDAALKRAEAAPPDTLQSFHSVALDALPATLGNDVRGLTSLIELRWTVREHARSRPSANYLADLKRELADLRLAHVEPRLTGEAQQDLAVQLLLAGHPAEARSLLPDQGPAEHAAELLGDLKALILDQGEVTTSPARQPIGGAGRNAPVAVPPGLRVRSSVVNEAGRSRVRLAAQLKPSPLDSIAQQEKPQRDRVAAGVQTAQTTFTEQGKAVLLVLRARQEAYQASAEEQQTDAKLLADLQSELKHELTPVERALALGLLRQRKNAPEISAALRRFTPQPGRDAAAKS